MKYMVVKMGSEMPFQLVSQAGIVPMAVDLLQGSPCSSEFGQALGKLK